MMVKELMSTPVVVVPSCIAVRDVARHMDYSGVGCVVLSDARGIVGVVTDRDLVLRVIARDGGGDIPAGDVMTPQPITVRPNDDLDVALNIFRRNSFRRLPVVDEGDVIGMLTVDDLLLHINQATADLLKPVVSEISEPQHPAVENA